MLAREYELTHRARLGLDIGDDKAAKTLNRIITVEDRGIVVEADQRHVEIAISEMELTGARGVKTPGTKEQEEEDEDQDEELGQVEARQFRSVAARLNFVAQDRADIQFCTKEGCREMARPTRRAWQALKRTARYLVQAPRMVQMLEYQPLPSALQVWSDSDYAGCKRTRKSTSGGVTRLGTHSLRTWSSTQAVIATSSGEAEYYAIVKASSMGLGMRSMAEDMGIALDLDVMTDSSAAKGMAQRRGLGKARHIDMCYLWVQERIVQKDLYLHKVGTDRNLADLTTKRLDGAKHKNLVSQMRMEARDGRHPLAPKLTIHSKSQTTCGL